MIFILSVVFCISILMICYYHYIIIQKTSSSKDNNNVHDNVHDDDSVEKRFESPVDRVEVEAQPVDKLLRSSTSSSKSKKLVTIASCDINLDDSNLALSIHNTPSKVLNIKN